jgi:hypothetical protein
MSNSELATKNDVAEGGIIGVVGGGIIGAFAGGPLGAILGAIVGGTASAGATSLLDKHRGTPELDTAGDSAFELPNPYAATSVAYRPVAPAVPMQWVAPAMPSAPSVTDAASESDIVATGHMETMAEDTAHQAVPRSRDDETEMVLPWVE